MSTNKSPVIKFSPFEALLIGEKNKILKRQPMKNTIFVTRISRGNKTFNLRDLFDIENDKCKTKNEDEIFKMPQRVRDFLKNRKLKGKNNVGKAKSDVMFYDFKKQKTIVKKNDALKMKAKNSKLKSNKVKFKKKIKYKRDIEGEIIRKIRNCSRRARCRESQSENFIPRLVIKEIKKKTIHGNRHLLRGKDGKFITKKEYENLKSNEISTKSKYLSNYLHQLYLKKNKNFFNQEDTREEESLNNFEAHLPLENVVGLPFPLKQFDITASEALLNEISKNYYDCNCQESVQFPKFPILQNFSDYDDDDYLLDIIYENFPTVKFQSKDTFKYSDFSDALREAEIISPVKCLKIYEKKRNGFFNSKNLTVIFNNHVPYIKLQNNSTSKSTYSYLNGRNGFASVIDEPSPKNNHLITTKSFECIFLRGIEGKEIFFGNLVKPFLQNSWFGRLPEI